MNFKTTILLILCLAIAGVTVYFTRNQSTTEAPPPSPVKLIDMPASDVVAVTFSPADNRYFSLEKQNGKWRITQPINAPADASAVESLLSSLTTLESHGKSDAASDVTGMDKPQLHVQLTDSTGKSVKLAVGKLTSVGGELFVMKEPETKPDRVPAEVYEQLTKSFTSYRDLKLLDIKTPEVKQLVLTNSNGSLTLDRNGNDWRLITGPTTMPADEAAVSDLIFALSGMRATEFASETSDDAKRWGLDDPQLTVTYTSQPIPMPPLTTRPTTAPTTLPTETGVVKFGRYDDLRKRNVYVTVSSSPAVATVPASSMAAFDKKPLDLRDKNLLRIPAAQVRGISIQTEKPATTQPAMRAAVHEMLTIARNPEAEKRPAAMAQATTASATTMAATMPTTVPATMAATAPAPPPKWLLSGDSKGPADEITVDGLLSMLEPLRVEKFLEKLPVSQPSDRYTLTISTTARTYTITITNPGGSQNPIGQFDDLTFEISRPLLEKLAGKFEPGAVPPPTPAMPPGMMPPGMSPMQMQ